MTKAKDEETFSVTLTLPAATVVSPITKKLIVLGNKRTAPIAAAKDTLLVFADNLTAELTTPMHLPRRLPEPKLRIIQTRIHLLLLLLRSSPPGAASPSPRAKQPPCFDHADGNCLKGDNCTYRHNPPMTEAEKAARLKARARSPKAPPAKANAADRSASRSKAICTNWQTDKTCKYGDKCHFVHPGQTTVGDPTGTVGVASPKKKRTRSRSAQRKKAPPECVVAADAERAAAKPPATAK